jgi:hypothetical protein
MTSAISSSSTNTCTNTMNYEPMYCLQEHLEYFASSVATELQQSFSDFDEIFGRIGEIDLLPSPSPSLDNMAETPRPVSPSSSVASSPSDPGVSPSSLEECFAPATPPASSKAALCPNPIPLAHTSHDTQRRRALVSPTTVTSAVIMPKAPAKKTRKRQISDDTEPALPSLRNVDPSEKEDVRR